jgi:hypothetical protein
VEAGTGTGGQQGEIRGRVMEGEQGGRTCTAAWNFAFALNGFDCKFVVVLRSCVVALPLVIH